MAERIGCFSCNKSVNWAEPYVCISRLRRIRRIDGNDEVVNAAASLQVCIYCVAKAQTDNINIHKEVPLLKAEEGGFYWFARHLTNNSEPRPQSLKEYSCTLCKCKIEPDDYYTEIDIQEEVKEREKPITVIPESKCKLAILCDKCAKEHMIWWYDKDGNIVEVV